MQPLCPERQRNEHAVEAVRIQGELDALDDSFADDGVVKTVLRARIAQELRRARGETK